MANLVAYWRLSVTYCSPQALEEAVLRGVGDLSERRVLELVVLVEPVDPFEGRVRQSPADIPHPLDGRGLCCRKREDILLGAVFVELLSPSSISVRSSLTCTFRNSVACSEAAYLLLTMSSM